MAACKQKGRAADFRKNASGYSHTYADAGNANLHFLSLFPSDAEIASAARDAYDEALSLWELLGYYPSTSVVVKAPTTNISPQHNHTNNDGDTSEEEDDEIEEHSDKKDLQNALDAAAKFQAKGLPSENVDATLDECGFAAASLNLADLENM